MMKLTNDQIEAIRAVSPELADKLEAGEAVTVGKAVEKWEPEAGAYRVRGDGGVRPYDGFSKYRANGSSRKTHQAADRLAIDQRIFNRLHAYREEFAPGCVVPPAGKMAWAPVLCSDGQYRAFGSEGRAVGCVYMPVDVCLDLCDKLNSGEVVL